MFQKIEGCLLESKVAYQDTALLSAPAEKFDILQKWTKGGGKGKLAVKLLLRDPYEIFWPPLPPHGCDKQTYAIRYA